MGDSISLSAATEKITNMIQGAVALLPNIVIGLIVFVIFWLVGKAVRRFVKAQTRDRDTRK